MPEPGLLEQWAVHVQQAVDNMQVMLRAQQADLTAFAERPTRERATADAMSDMTWHNILDWGETQVLQARQALTKLQHTQAQGLHAIEEVLHDAGRWPPEAPIDTTFKTLVQSGQQAVDGTVRIMQGGAANAEAMAGNTLQTLGSTVNAAVPVAEAATPAVEAIAAEAVPVIEAIVPAIESSLPAVEAALPSIEAAIPSIEAAIPSIEAAVPSIEAALPSIEASIVPAIESVIPSIEAALPSIEASIVPAVEAIVPVIEQNAPVIVGTGTALAGGAMTAEGGTLVAGATAGIPGGPIGIAIGIGITLVLIGGAWWYVHKKPAVPPTDVAAVATTVDPVADGTTLVPPPPVSVPNTVPESTTLPLFVVTTQPGDTATSVPTPPPGGQPLPVPTTTRTTAPNSPGTTAGPTATSVPASASTSTSTPATTAAPVAGAATLQIKAVSTKACNDSGNSKNDFEHHVTLDNKPVPFTPGDYTGRTDVAPGTHTIGGTGTVISITISRLATEVVHQVTPGMSFDFSRDANTDASSTDYVVALRFKDSSLC